MPYALNDIVSWFIHYKYLMLFPVSVLEGPIVTIIGGFLAAQGVLNVYLVLILVIAGDLVGDTFYYCLGRFGGRPFILKWGRFIGIDAARIEHVEMNFNKSAGKILSFGKFQPYGSIILTAAGLAQTDYLKFIWINFLISSVKSVVFLALGYYFGQAYNLIGTYLNYVGIILTVLAVVIIGGYMVYKRYAKNRDHN